jgi:hypothetical protein
VVASWVGGWMTTSSKERIYKFKMKLLVNERKIIMKEKHTWAQMMTGIIWAHFAFVLSSHYGWWCLVGDMWLVVGG